MSESELEKFVDSQFKLPIHLCFLIFSILIICIEFILDRQQLLTYPPWLVFLGCLVLAFTVIPLFVHRVIEAISKRSGFLSPVVVLWLHPLLTLLCALFVAWSLLRVVPVFAGRDFWTRLIGLNAKTVTGAFTESFAVFVSFLLFWTLMEAWRYIRWSIGWKDFAEKLSASSNAVSQTEAMLDRRIRQGTIQADRKKALRYNRLALAAVLGALIASWLWVLVEKPYIFLYYRGAIAVDFKDPKPALEAFEELVKRYPNYRYIDKVKYNMAWLYERRLHDYTKAVEAYMSYLSEYGYDNPWADDVVANLIRIYADKLAKPAEALKWILQYQKFFPEGMMAQHVALYKIKALSALGRITEAKAALEEADRRFGGSKIVLYDENDDFAGRISFKSAAAIFEKP